MAVTLYRPKQKGGTTVRSSDTDQFGKRKYGQWPVRARSTDITAADLDGFRLAVLHHHGQTRAKRARTRALACGHAQQQHRRLRGRPEEDVPGADHLRIVSNDGRCLPLCSVKYSL